MIDEVKKNLRTRGLLDGVKGIVSERHLVLDDVLGRCRSKATVAGRHACWKWLREFGFSYPEIGRIWDVDHATVLVAVKGGRKR
jgi:chromosomal replication initiation ATPase DnaA